MQQQQLLLCVSRAAIDVCATRQALYAYKAEDEDELTISEGDILTIEDEDDEGWYAKHDACILIHDLFFMIF